MIKYKSAWEIDLMRQAGRLVGGCLRLARELVKPGLTTGKLDEKLTEFVVKNGGEMAFMGYRGYPANICVSINEEVVHGIPGPRRIKSGDIVSIDVGVRYKNYYADAAISTGVGELTPVARKLLEITRQSLEQGIRLIKPGARLGEISGAIQDFAEAADFSVVKKYVGHGIGSELHEDPQVPNYRMPPEEQTDILLKPGMVLAIEPMVNEGTWDVETLPNNWTVVTRDRKLSAHFEHTVAVTESGYEILTAE